MERKSKYFYFSNKLRIKLEDLIKKYMEKNKIVLDDLELNGYKIYQKEKGFKFGIDAVLLSDFTKEKRKGTWIDFCSGSGVIPILMKAKKKGNHFIAVEFQEEYYKLGIKSIKYNNLEDKILMGHFDINDRDNLKKFIKENKKDKIIGITVNPPYMKKSYGLISKEIDKAIGRSEIMCTLEDVVREASFYLNDKGSLFMVHRGERLGEIIKEFYINHITPKRIRMVHSKAHERAKLVLIEGQKNANEGIIVEKPIIVYNSKGEYSDDILEIYGKI